VSPETLPKQSTSCTLLFPKYFHRNLSLRISEQEARFAFSEVLNKEGLYYSVETPTEKEYQLSGKKKLSALTDLAVYSNKFDRLFNVEFKSKGASPDAKSHFSIGKDIQKLLREEVNGLWFHLLKAVDNSTLLNLMRVFADKITSVSNNYRPDISRKTICFHICVLEHGFSIHKCIDFPDGGIHVAKTIYNEMNIEVKVSRTEIQNIVNDNGWDVHRAK
jgi:hypothetical protein